MKKKTVSSFRKMKEAGEKIVMLTAYDAPAARFAHEAGIDLMLVGDSAAMTMLGYSSTIYLPLEESLNLCRAVRRGAPDAFIIGDMPFLTFNVTERDSLLNAGRYIQEALCDAVKFEGGAEVAPLVARMVECGIPVCGHIGLLPQRVMTAGGYKVVGRAEADAERVLADALALEAAGAFMIVLECVPAALAEKVTKQLSIPTIGIGAGAATDGQVQVIYDILGYDNGFLPKHAKRYAQVGSLMTDAIRTYTAEVKNGTFPTKENMF